MTDPAGKERTPASREAGKRSACALILLIACSAVAFAGFLALGTWQLYRLQWKLDLIQRVEQRIHADPVPVPDTTRWSLLSASSDEYRRVRVSGKLLFDKTVRVQAVSTLGSGYWLLTPLHSADGTIVLINRGFVPSGTAQQTLPESTETVTITGLLRMTEPEGGFLRKNDPANRRWYSRDVAAIATAQGLDRVAPFFIDADAQSAKMSSLPTEAVPPAGGLTVVAFHNNHLVYALTWYALALLMAGAMVWIVRAERKRLHVHGTESTRNAGKRD